MHCKQPLTILLLGEASSGKTALFTRLDRDTFSSQYRPTIGADFICKDLSVGTKTETVRIRDSPGRNRFFNCFGWRYLKEAGCCVLVYDITSRDSFNSVEVVLEKIMSETMPADNFPFILVGNKTDREQEREVGWSEAQTWARRHGDMPLFQTSAMDNSNVTAVFEEAASLAFGNMKYISALL